LDAYQFLEVKGMPNEKVLSEKQAIVASLTEKLQSASAGVLVEYAGTTVAVDTELRRKMRAAGVDYAVVKNTLLRFAANNTGLGALDPFLNGTTALAISTTDPVAPAKILSEYAKKNDSTIKIKAGFVEGKTISAAEVTDLAELPSREVLVAQVLGTLLALWGVDLLLAMAPAGLPRIDEVSVNASVLLFTAGVTVLTGVLFGAFPALHAARSNVSSMLKDGMRGSSGGASRAWRPTPSSIPPAAATPSAPRCSTDSSAAGRSSAAPNWATASAR
jgi:large subunit ribosomal protein L10